MAELLFDFKRTMRRACLLGISSLALGACEPTGFQPGPRPVRSTASSTSQSDGTAPDTPRPVEAVRVLPGGRSSASASSASPAPPPASFTLDGSVRRVRPYEKEEISNVVLSGGWTWRGRPDPATDASPKGVGRAKKATAADWRIDLSTGTYGRMRIALPSRGFSVPAGSELLALKSHYGTVLSWPRHSFYRVLAPGSVRPLLDEGRADVVPLATGQFTKKGASRRADRATKKWLLTSPIGELDLEVALLPEAAQSGPLLCRLFVELVGIHPSSKVCQAGEVPLFASYRWRLDDTVRSGNWFEVTRIQLNPVPATNRIVVPPAGAKASTRALPLPKSRLLLTGDERAALRGSQPVSAKRSRLRNGSERALYLLLDGVAVAWVEPDEVVTLGSLPAGSYTVQWRSFLGDVVSETTEKALPARIDYKFADPLSDASATPQTSATPPPSPSKPSD